MSTVTRSANGRLVRRPLLDDPGLRAEPRSSPADALALAAVFAATVLRYLFRVLPQASSELAHWRALAADIPDPGLARTAREALSKQGNIEGAALFATLAPAVHRARTVRALVAFQAAYNYLDALSERPSEDPVANGDQLHEALLVALEPGAPHLDYYRHNPERDDGGFLTAILDACRLAVADLPSFPALGPTARTAAARIVDFQALNLSDVQGGHDGLQRWAMKATPPGSGFEWWETAAAAGSSLSVHALIAAAAHPNLDRRDAAAIDGAYFPWLGALHSLLDSLVDRAEDYGGRRRCLLDYYNSPADAVLALSSLAVHARGAAERLPGWRTHRVILTAMCSYYLSAPQCDTAEAHATARALIRVLGLPLRVAIAMFRAKRLLHARSHRAYT